MAGDRIVYCLFKLYQFKSKILIKIGKTAKNNNKYYQRRITVLDKTERYKCISFTYFSCKSHNDFSLLMRYLKKYDFMIITE